MNTIKIYDKKNIDEIILPNNYDAKYAFDYFEHIIQNGVENYISNVKADVKLLVFDNLVLPLVFTEKQYRNSYVASLYTHYIAYAKEELWELNNKWLEFILKIFLNILGAIFKWGEINKVVYVNNWFLSTNLYPRITEEQLRQITVFLREKYPDRAIVFRSINDYLMKENLEHFKKLGYELLAGRQVYIFDKNKRTKLKGNPKYKLNKDIKRLENSSCEVVELTREYDLERVLNLYNQLYLNKYSLFNPQFNMDFLTESVAKKLFAFRAFVFDDRIDAVLGYFRRNETITTPIFGYDLSLPKETDLYKIMSARLVLEAEDCSANLNMSSGASKFKLYRGGVAAIEYNTVYFKHLSLRRKCIYRLAGLIYSKLALYLLKKYEL